jgi:uncharacterized protein YegP (UPF0339 family)
LATATKKSRALTQLAQPPARVHGLAAMEFLIFEDNGGSYHWRILADDDVTLGQSGDFASYDEAERAAQQIRERGSGSSEAVAQWPAPR